MPRSRTKFLAVKQTTKMIYDFVEQVSTAGCQDMESINQSSKLANSISELIRSRATRKVLGDVASPVAISKLVAAANDPKVISAIRTAGWAPFHYDRAIDGIAEPWRIHVLWNAECRKVANHLTDWFDDLKPSNKLPSMLSACGALILVNWLPQFQNDSEDSNLVEAKEKQVQIDEEHLAATAALVQNLILVLTSEGMGTYWSSGGQFRTSKMFDRLGIPQRERMLAALFVEYPETMDSPNERLAGKQRDKRSEPTSWLKEIRL